MLAVPASAVGGSGFEDVCLSYPSHLPEIFGPPMWWTIHTMASGYPEKPSAQKQADCEAFVRALPGMLPCSACGIHLREELANRDIPLACSSNTALSLLWCEVHNTVNERLGKPVVDCARAQSEYSLVPICNSAQSLNAPPSSSPSL
jgi:FAD-linked sulfhydryl oxidase